MKIIQLTDNSWILKKNDITIGTLFKSTNGLLFMSPERRKQYSSFEDFQKDWGIKKIINDDDVSSSPDDCITNNINGFPIKHKNIKIIENANPPQYIKGNTNSKAIFAAGYWVVKNDNFWVTKLCPKLLTIKDNESHGPFKSRLEMNNVVKILNQEIKMSGIK
jgi:hypothetical protein